MTEIMCINCNGYGRINENKKNCPKCKGKGVIDN